MHAEGQFVLGDPAGNLGVSDVSITDGVESSQGIKCPALAGSSDARRVGQVQDGVALSTEWDSLVGRRQETTGPV